VGIRSILNPVASNICQILKPTIGLVLFGLLSGCAEVVVVFGQPLAELALYGLGKAEAANDRQNYYEPIVLTSNEEMIQIKYLSVGPNAEHEQVLKLITNHCDGSYIEASRVELSGWTTVEAECTHDTDS
jgi:hypothetical protein